MSRQAKNQLPASPIEFRRTDPDELAKFDPSTKICTMNCGQRSDDPRSPAECKMLCDDCQKVSPKPPAPARDDILSMAREAGFITGTRDYADGSGALPYVQSIATNTFLPELERFRAIATERERSARQAAQVENESLKARLARAGIEQRKAVLEEREACAKVCEGRRGGALQTNEWWDGFKTASKQIAAGIRARGLA